MPGRSIVVSKHRIEALTDGVYAIAMTLAVLSIDVAAIQPPTEETLGASMGMLFEQLRHYVISFLTLGAFWIGQHLQFEKLKAVDIRVVWISLFHLLFITLIPFTTALTAKFAGSTVSVQIFAANFFCISVTSLLGWRYVESHRELMVEGIDPDVISRTSRILSVMPVMAIAVFVTAWFFPDWASMLFILLPVIHRKFR
jgi:uncharacterized membrane protein